MRKLALLPALLCSALATPASAQFELPSALSRVSVSAFSGVRVPFVTGDMRGVDSTGAEVFYLSERRGGNPILGLEAKMLLVGPVSLVAAGVFSPGGEREFFVPDTTFRTNPDVLVKDGANVLFGKLAASVRIAPEPDLMATRARPSTELFGGVAVVREMRSSHPALNLGFNGVLPVAPGVEFTLGIEDYLVFWNQGLLRARLTENFQRLGSPVADVHTFYDTSNILLVRVGVSLHP